MVWFALVATRLAARHQVQSAVRSPPGAGQPPTPAGSTEPMDPIGTGDILHPQTYSDYRYGGSGSSACSSMVTTHLDEASMEDNKSALHDRHWECRSAKYDVQHLLPPKKDGTAESMSADAGTSTNWTVLYDHEMSVLFQARS
jgi:hypothetical protein